MMTQRNSYKTGEGQVQSGWETGRNIRKATEMDSEEDTGEKTMICRL